MMITISTHQLLRAIATSAAGVWLGGMILIAIVAQTTFSVMRQTGVDQPNTVAGQIMAVNFTRFDKVQMICAAVLVLSQTVLIIAGERKTTDWLRLVLILLATGMLLYSVTVLTPKITNLQSAVGTPDPEAAVKAVFDDFHDTAVRISKVNLVLVTLTLFSLAWPSKRKKEAQYGGADWQPPDEPPSERS
ncbi:MAG: DUF4149 domain-containing protein [Phycisphaerales bacterium]|nr:DUF4149 domain-containing protein [Phycisphaerales bacterium]